MRNNEALLAIMLFFASWGVLAGMAWFFLRIPSKSERKVAAMQSALDARDDDTFFDRLPGIVRHLSHSLSLFKWVPYYDEPPLEDRKEYFGFFHYHFAVERDAEFESYKVVRNICLGLALALLLPVSMSVFLGHHFSYLMFFLFSLPWSMIVAMLIYVAWKYPLCLMRERELFERVHARLRRMMAPGEEDIVKEGG